MAWISHKNRSIDQQNSIETLEVNSCIFPQLIFDEGAESIYWKKESFLLLMLGKLDVNMWKNETRPGVKNTTPFHNC